MRQCSGHSVDDGYEYAVLYPFDGQLTQFASREDAVEELAWARDQVVPDTGPALYAGVHIVKRKATPWERA